MADDLPTVTGDDFQSYFQQRANNAVGAALPQADDDTDRAVRAQQLGAAIGVPSAVVYQNLDHYERQARVGMQTGIIRNNPHLQDYINDHPMAPKVSANDWANLDEASQKLNTFGTEGALFKGVKGYWDYIAKPTLRTAAAGTSEFAKGFWHGYEEIKPGQMGTAQFGDTGLGHIMDVIYGLAPASEQLNKLQLGIIRGVAQGAAGVYSNVTGQDGERVAQNIEQAAMDPGLLMSIPEFGPALEAMAEYGMARQALRRSTYTARRITPYLDSREEPPVGLDALTDHAKAGQAELDAENLKALLEASRKSETRDVDPDMFARFIRMRNESEIGIDSEAVRKLYGETVPMPDDGILGWVPKIEDQLQHTQLNGGDIRVPLADWLAHVEPEVAKELQDNLRIRRNGLTLEEAKALKPIDIDEDLFVQPNKHIEAVEDVRRSAGLRPLADLTGEQPKYTLKPTEPANYMREGEHEFDIIGQDGKPIGELFLKEEGNNLHIQHVQVDGGPWGIGARALADGMEQLKTLFPKATTISGNRISGARERFGMAGEGGALPPRIFRPLADLTANSALDLAQTIRERNGTRMGVDAEGNRWLGFGDPQHEVWLKPKASFTEKERALIEQVHGLVQKIIPQYAAPVPFEQIAVGGGEARGLYQPRSDAMPFIFWAIGADDALGVMRHEAIHHLKRYGFFTPSEWTVLRQAAIDGKWIDKYDIRNRYPNDSLASMLEESVAEGFKEWQRGKYDKRTGMMMVSQSPLDQVMYKLHKVWNSIRTAVRGVLGYDADWKDLFHKAETGEIGARLGTKPLDPRVWSPAPARGEGPPKQLEIKEATRLEDRDLFEKGNALGMTKKQYETYLDKIAEQDLEDMKYAAKQNLKDITKRQTTEWKAAEKDAREEIEPAIRNRPDVVADRFLLEGVLYDEKIRGRPRLDSEKLTDEQKQMLPKGYYTKGGIHPDDAAGLFGFTTGDELVDSLIRLNVDRGNLKPRAHIQRMIQQAVDAKMEATHGDLTANIAAEAQDHMLGQTQLDLIHEKTLALASQAGMEMSLTKEDMKRMARESFERMQRSQVGSVKDNLQAALKAGDKTEKALLDGDAKEAFRQQQAQELSLYLAKEAQAFEKVEKTFNRLARKYTDRTIAGVDPPYKNYIQELMQRFGLRVNRVPGDLETEIAAGGHGTLKEFIDETNGQFGNFAIDERFYDPSFAKPANQLTVEEFKALTAAIKGLDKQGRDARKVIKAGAKEDLADLVGQAKDSLETFDFKQTPARRETVPGKLSELVRQFFTVKLLQAETWLNRWDRDNVNGVFNQWFVRPLVEGANYKATLGREYAAKWKGLGELADPHKKVRSPFIDPDTITEADPQGRPYSKFTRSNLFQMISNAGNEYNWDVMTKGHNSTMSRQALANMTTKADWVRAEKIGKIFNEAFELAQGTYRHLYGEAPPKIELQPFTVNFPNGETFTSEGWYHPIIRDQQRTNLLRKATGEDMLEKTKGLFPSIANGYTKQRTGKIDVLDLTGDMVTHRLSQILHDVAFRIPVVETAKLVKDQDFRRTLRQRAGKNYQDMLDHWLEDVAGGSKRDDRLVTWASNAARTNVIGTLIGWNPGTVLKHGPTALINSMYEAGLGHFLKAFAQTTPGFALDAVKTLYGRGEDYGTTTRKFIHDHSEEIARRTQHWNETFGGAEDIIGDTGSWFTKLRAGSLKWGSKPVAISDLISAEPTWLAVYMKEMSEHGVEGDAVFAADRAVRRAHGSTSIVSQPELVRRAGALGSWLTTLYGFFGTQMQRRAEIAFKANDVWKLGREGELKASAKKMGEIVPLAFASVIWPTIVEEFVTGIGTDDHRTGLERLVDASIMGLGTSFLYLRDITHGEVTGHPSGVGLLSTVGTDLDKVVRHIAHPQKAFSRENAGKTVEDFVTLMGYATGTSPKQVGKVIRYGMGLNQRTEPGRNIPVGLMRGTEKRRVEK